MFFDHSSQVPENATAAIVFSDGGVLWGYGIGVQGQAYGEICFNTSMCGYQEILTDPSYAGQMITFTYPHIGNTGTNVEDIESQKAFAKGLILREPPTAPSSWRAKKDFDDWLVEQNLVGITGIDTRALTQYIRDNGAPNAIICHNADGKFDLESLRAEAKNLSGLNGKDLAIEVTCSAPYNATEALWSREAGYAENTCFDHHIVAVDFGIKTNILRHLCSLGAKVTVVPCTTSAKDILNLNPDGVFLSNGPGDPAATGEYAVPVIQELIKSGLPVFGICLGHQLLSLALGGKTEKMHLGHRGANHPVKSLKTGLVEITSQNHGFMVIPDSLPDTVETTHISLFDQTNEGVALKGKPVFSVQYHPESSPGPQDSHYLFGEFLDCITSYKKESKVA